MFFTAFEKAKQSKQKTSLQSYKTEIKILTYPGLVYQHSSVLFHDICFIYYLQKFTGILHSLPKVFAMIDSCTVLRTAYRNIIRSIPNHKIATLMITKSLWHK